MWSYRELIYFLTLRDIKVRYKQTVVGIAWVVLQPLAMVAVFSLFFGRLARIPSEGLPYPLFALAGFLPWQFFSRSLLDSTQSLIVDQRLITRVYFPRLTVPLAVTLAAVVDLLIGFLMLLGLMVFYGAPITLRILWLPVFGGLLFLTSLGAGLWLSALNVEYRDVTYVVPFLNQFWLFVTPVVYPLSFVPRPWSLMMSVNPMAAVVEGFRWSVLGVGPGLSLSSLISVGVTLVLFATGTAWFRSRERAFVDALGSGGR
jgi:lipopolysaccharide transport system permease protein